MSGSYKHIVDDDGSFLGTECLLDNMSDAVQALEECYWMIQFLAGGNRLLVEEAERSWIEYKRVSSGGCVVRLPVPIILYCPICKERHVDVGLFAKQPHHTHACQHCGHVWRPAVAHTVGVQFLPGCKDK